MARIEPQSVFASDLNLRPGQWPIRVTIDGEVYKFVRHEYNDEREVVAGIYTHITSFVWLTIFND